MPASVGVPVTAPVAGSSVSSAERPEAPKLTVPASPWVAYRSQTGVSTSPLSRNYVTNSTSWSAGSASAGWIVIGTTELPMFSWFGGKS